MDLNDYEGSFAQENVKFATQVIRTTEVGDNYWKLMVFIETDRFVDSTTSDWVDFKVSDTLTVKTTVVTAETYSKIVNANSLLSTWLYDFFISGTTVDCILVAVTAKDDDDFVTKMEAAYDELKAYAYFKTVCAGGDTAVTAPIALSLAKKCTADKALLSSVPLLPFVPENVNDPSTDAVYAAITGDTTADAFMSYVPNASSNPALFSIGQALVPINGSGTRVGNGIYMTRSGSISSSMLKQAQREALLAKHIQVRKPVGNNSGEVAAEGQQTLQGDYVVANWVKAYVAYMVKVKSAELITQMNFWRDENSYQSVLTTLGNYLGKFGDNGSRRLYNLNISAPAYSQLPPSATSLTIPNAWSARMRDVVNDIDISGTLYIGG